MKIKRGERRTAYKKGKPAENGRGMQLTAEEQMVLALLRQALTGGEAPVAEGIQWDRVIGIAQRHAALPLLFPVLSERKSGLGPEEMNRIREVTLTCARQNIRLAWETARAQKTLEKAGLPTAVLKGGGVGALYPVPEYRKSGDVDLFLIQQQADGEKQQKAFLKEQMRRAQTALEEIGYRPDMTHAPSNHVVFENADGIRLELHTFLTEPVDNDAVNQKIWEIQRSGVFRTRTVNTAGQEITVLSGAGQAFALLLHMLHHFLRSGFGLKLLADWVVFWNHAAPDKQTVRDTYQRLVTACGLTGFSDLVTSVCARYLGLTGLEPLHPSDPALFIPFLREIFSSGEFGEEDKTRMVTLRGTGVRDYIREFHHRMKLNFPGASAYPVLYPVLWTRTLVRFLYNNRKVRGITARAALRRAGERSRFMKQLHLFETEPGNPQ